MTLWTLIFRSLRFHARSHLGALLGAAVGSAVLIGALVVGDSVRGSLRNMALARLGRVQIALAANDRFFRAALSDELAHKGLIEGTVASTIALPATASRSDDSARANRAQVLGVDDRFWRLSEEQPTFKSPSADEVILNQPLARQLKATTGDSVVLRVAKPGRLSREAPISPQEDSSVSLRLKVTGVASDAEFGRFGLRASQVAPFNAFVSLAVFDGARDGRAGGSAGYARQRHSHQPVACRRPERETGRPTRVELLRHRPFTAARRTDQRIHRARRRPLVWRGGGPQSDAGISGYRKGREHARLGPQSAGQTRTHPAQRRGLLEELSRHAEGVHNSRCRTIVVG